jgi:hypothetical protein
MQGFSMLRFFHMPPSTVGAQAVLKGLEVATATKQGQQQLLKFSAGGECCGVFGGVLEFSTSGLRFCLSYGHIRGKYCDLFWS